MRPTPATVLAVTIPIVLFGVVTDSASSHRLSNFIVTAFDSTVGETVALVRPAVSEHATSARQDTVDVAAPKPQLTYARQSPPLAEAIRTEVAATEPAVPTRDAVVIEPHSRGTVASSLFESVSNESSGGSRGTQTLSSGGGGGGAGSAGASYAGAGRESASADTSAGLMDLVMSDIDGQHRAMSFESSFDPRGAFSGSSGSSGAASSPMPFESVSASDRAASLKDVFDELVPELSMVSPLLVTTATLEPVLEGATLPTTTIVNPEPATLLLFGTGLALAASRMRQRRLSKLD